MGACYKRERYTIGSASLRPPRHDPPPDADNLLRPGSCLLDVEAYLDNRRNATTASCKARNGALIRVTFFIAHPPRLSHFTVCCPGKSPYQLFADEPSVVAAEEDLVLIRMAFRPVTDACILRKFDFFIYRAAGGGRAPSLTRILPPKPFVFLKNCHVALLPRYEEDPHLYYIVILHKRTVPPHRQEEEDDIRFDIHIYSSKTASWSCKPTSLVKQSDHDRVCHFTSYKVITIGGEGGAVAWVDLWRGFLQCDVLKETVPTLYYGRLPPDLDHSSNRHSDPHIRRDVALIQGRIKVVRLQTKPCPEIPYRRQGWTFAIYSRTAANPCEVGWQQDGNAIELDAKYVSANPMVLQYLPKLPDDTSGTPEPSPETTEKRLRNLTCPMLSLHQDDHVYVMARVSSSDIRWDGSNLGLGLAFDLSKGTLEKVVQVNAARSFSGLVFFIMPSRISKYLDMYPGSRFVFHQHAYFAWPIFRTLY